MPDIDINFGLLDVVLLLLGLMCVSVVFVFTVCCNTQRNQAARHSMSEDLYFTSVSFLSFFLSLFLSFFLFAAFPRSPNGTQRMAGSKCSLKKHVQNLEYPLPLQIGGSKTTFLDDFAT